jgi:hypothetical protein
MPLEDDDKLRLGIKTLFAIRSVMDKNPSAPE